MVHFSLSIPRHSGAATKPYNDAKSLEACYEEIGYRTICGPWSFEVEGPDCGRGDRPEREADD
jgi:hypothetical protein